ncbi:MAG TPA: amidohydrolase family protein, partial [Bryobacteraceae bacterium]
MSENTIPVGTTLLLKGGRALLPDADWHDPERADVAIAGDTIAGIASDYRLDDPVNVEVIDARNYLVLPGFVNAHYHSHDVLAKGTLEEVPLESWRLYALPPQYPPRSTEEVYARTLLGAFECLRSGITTIQDMLTLYPYEERHMDVVMKAYREVGIRVVFALQYADRKGIETVPFWKETFPSELHPLLSTSTEPERQLDLIRHFEQTRLQSPPPP